MLTVVRMQLAYMRMMVSDCDGNVWVWSGNLTLTLAITIDLKRVKFRHVVPSSSVPYIHMHPSSPQPPAFTLYSLPSATAPCVFGSSWALTMFRYIYSPSY